MTDYISPNHLVTNSTMAFKEITSVVFNRHGEEWLCDLYEAGTHVASGRDGCMEFALTSAVYARNAALSNAKGS
jgi:hypothetical protein